MTADEAIASHKAFIGVVGETVSVRRYTGTGPTRTYADTTALARVTGFQPKDLVGSIVQGDRKVIMLVDTLSSVLPLTTADSVIIRGREVKIKAIDDNTRRIGGTLIALELQVAG